MSEVEISQKNTVRKIEKKPFHLDKKLFLLLAIVPPFGGYLVFTLYPNLLSIYYAFLDWNGMTEPVFVGFDNFVAMFKDEFVWRALYHNIILMIIIPILVIFISLVLAYPIAYKNYRENGFLKLLFFFPNILSIVAIALMWSFIYDGNYGLLNGLLSLLGFDMKGFYWLGNEQTALWSIIPPWIWGGVGLYVIIFINAMLAIPKSFYESAILEGAGDIAILFKITLPMILPIARVSALFLVVGTIKTIELVLILTNGGPTGSTDVIGLYMFNLAFGEGSHNYGYASAIGMLLFVILGTGKLLIDKYMKKRGLNE